MKITTHLKKIYAALSYTPIPTAIYQNVVHFPVSAGKMHVSPVETDRELAYWLSYGCSNKFIF